MPKTPNKKQIFLDVDGVLLDFHTKMLKEKHSIDYEVGSSQNFPRIFPR